MEFQQCYAAVGAFVSTPGGGLYFLLLVGTPQKQQVRTATTAINSLKSTTPSPSESRDLTRSSTAFLSFAPCEDQQNTSAVSYSLQAAK